MDDREKREQPESTQDGQKPAEPEDLDVTAEEAEDVKGGGKVNMQDFHFVQRSTKSSP